ncbi:MAG: acetate--CoA ligase family protein [Candidatus Rokubacteria bacterium]|nr:acetate--CoA ligase family protein [Candidatus Rokubacteria bacterium]
MKGALAAARAEGRRALSEVEAAALLADYGLPVCPFRLCRSAEDLETALRAVPPPWVVKIVSPDILHKTEVGGVIVGLRSLEGAREAFGSLVEHVAAVRPSARLDGVLVQPQVEGALAEMLLGVSRDEQFGPVVLAGLGGIFAEALDDVALRVAPVDAAEARAMLRELRGYRILTGFRDRPAGDVEGLADALVRLSRLASELEDEIAEVDLNPVMVLPAGRGVVAVDALVTLRGPRPA